MASFDMIADLKPKKNMWKIRVKIIRIWKQYSVVGGESIEMVLVDSNGDKIHGCFKKDEVTQYEGLIGESESKLMANFIVTQSCGSYRTTPHPYKIVFLPTTRVRNCEDLPRNLTGFNPVNYKDLMSGNLDGDFLVDVMGQVLEISHLDVVSVHGKDTPKLALELRNTEDDRLPIVLWGKFPEDVNDAVLRGSEDGVMLVMRFGKTKVVTPPILRRIVGTDYGSRKRTSRSL
ncbi:uncharacterized protein LOC130505966 [Raphanus sativus]|uniref:Uncharacterized protein LOC130505966 n=1 Tax=Raphanus sativus TaxID=3726 RepID=A0A9W3CYI3_RAPSA|nr:uncharacterized protein LOC130505966 [Raphanus sativus]